MGTSVSTRCWINAFEADALGVAVGDSPYRAQFGMLHGISSVFYLVQSLLGLALIWKAAGVRQAA